MSVAAGAFALSGCFSGASTDYEVLGQLENTLPASTNAPEEFDFNATLRVLYPKSEIVVIAAIQSVDKEYAVAQVVKSFDEELLCEDDTFTLVVPSNEVPDEEGIYFLFLSEEDGKYTAVVDDHGLITLRDDMLYSRKGSSVSLARAMTELDKMESYIYIPSYFYYSKDLETLAGSSKMIFAGRVTGIETLTSAMFYVREPGLEEISTQAATVFTIEPVDVLKGDVGASEIQVVLSDDMYRNTIIDSTFDNPAYSKDSMPEISVDGDYLFFLAESSAGKHGQYMLFINPYQGYVPLYSDSLIGIPINAPFSYSQNYEDVRIEICDMLESAFTYSPTVKNSYTVELP